MTVQFMLEFSNELVDEETLGNIKVIDTTEDPERYGCGFEILEVKVKDIEMIRVKTKDGMIYVAEVTEKFKDGKDEKQFVTIWTPVSDDKEIA